MKAVTFDVSVPRYLLGKTLGSLTSSVTFGALSGVKLRDIPEPHIPGPDWVRLQVLYAGICGTDILFPRIITAIIVAGEQSNTDTEGKNAFHADVDSLRNNAEWGCKIGIP